MTTINVTKAFSRTPGPRLREEGEFSGEQFRQEVLWPAVKAAMESNENLLIDLDGTSGFGTSFLDEAFGGLIRDHGVPIERANQILNFNSREEPYLIDDINGYMRDASKR